MARINIIIGDKLKDQINGAVDHGHAATKSDFIRSAIREKLQRL